MTSLLLGFLLVFVSVASSYILFQTLKRGLLNEVSFGKLRHDWNHFVDEMKFRFFNEYFTKKEYEKLRKSE